MKVATTAFMGSIRSPPPQRRRAGRRAGGRERCVERDGVKAEGRMEGL